MHDSIVVLQDSDFETFFWTPDGQDPESTRYLPVEQIIGLTPSDLLLASLGASTAREINLFARDQGLSLQQVELRLRYQVNGGRMSGIDEEIVLYGELSPVHHDQLLAIANQCSIHKMLNEGMDVVSRVTTGR
jgi:uncharacterized OsmC-like protein